MLIVKNVSELWTLLFDALNENCDTFSWNIKAIQVLPEYMKISFLALYNTVNELAYDALRQQGHDILPYLTKAVSTTTHYYVEYNFF